MPKGKQKLKKFSIGWFQEKMRHPEVAPWLVLVVLITVSGGLEYGHPFPVYFPWVISTMGWLIVTLSVFVIWAAQVFLTEADRDKGTDRLKTWGLYSYSRNPMYLGYIVFLIGIGLGAGSGWFILIGAWTGPLLTWYVIPAEEKKLEKEFGDAYRRYRKKTRRWL